MANKLPNTWKEVPLSDLFNLIRGVSYNKQESSTNSINGYIPILRANNITDGKLNFQDLVYVNTKFASIEQRMQVGDIIIAMSSGSKSIVGKAAQMKEHWEGSFGAFCSVARPLRTIDQFYLGYFFQSKFYRDSISNLSSGININNIRKEYFDQIKIPFPPWQEQKRISSLLDDFFDDIFSIQDRLRTFPNLIQNFRQQILYQAFTGKLTKEWRKENDITEKWRKVKLKDFSIKIGSGATPRGGQEAYQEKGIPLIRSMNVYFEGFYYDGIAFINKKQADELKNVMVKKNDVLLNITGASIGRVCLAPANMDGARVNQHVCIIRTKPSLSQFFLAYYLSSPKMQKYINTENYGATRQALTKNMIENFEIMLPDIKEQNEVVKRIKSIFKRIEKVEKQYILINAILKELPQVILEKAFTGKLVSRNSNDEPVEKLIERVRHEKEESLVREKVAMKKRLIKRMNRKIIEEKGKKDLLEIIKSYPQGISPENLLKEAQYELKEIDEFYKNLKSIRDQIIEIKPEDSKDSWPNKKLIILKFMDK